MGTAILFVMLLFCAVLKFLIFLVQRLFRELELDNVQLVMYVSYGALLVMTPMFLLQNAVRVWPSFSCFQLETEAERH